MKVWTDEPTIHAALAVCNAKQGDNIMIKNLRKDGRGYRFTITVKDSSKQGARRSYTGRRIAAACWHAYRDLILALFDLGCERVQSCRADWHSRDHFLTTYEVTGNENIGSILQPLCYADACECE